MKTQVLVSHSIDGGDTWTQVAVDLVQKYPEEDNLTRMAVAKDGKVYVTWLRCVVALPKRPHNAFEVKRRRQYLVFAKANSASDNAHRLATAQHL